ncbi:MAG: transglycosylase SLT domain-containing protein [Synergistaceae bacterium]|nr:transglycosylase SLT domain-containing protein [Synergistaceae bacterium]
MKNQKGHFLLTMSIRVLGVGILLAYMGVPPASAEPEAYDFPSLQQSGNPVSLISPAMPTFDHLLSEDVKSQMIEQDQKRRNDAKRKSIAALFQRYNKNLNDESADKYALYIMQACQKFDQDPFVIAAMIVNESSAKYNALSRGGDYGLMQVRWSVHQKKIKKKYPHIAKAHDMFDPQYNVLVGTEIFSTYYATAKQDIRGALMYYSAGNERLADRVCAVLAQLEKAYLEHLKNG